MAKRYPPSLKFQIVLELLQGEHPLGNSAPIIVEVAVPAELIDVNSQTVSDVSAPFTDADEADTHTCSVDFGDGSAAVAGTVAGYVCDAQDHTYGAAGVYEVTITVEDNDGGSDTETSTSFIDIYDPSSYDWLVISGKTKAKYKGNGWIENSIHPFFFFFGCFKANPQIQGKEGKITAKDGFTFADIQLIPE